LLNVAGSPTDLVHEVLEGTCGGGLISRYVSDNDVSTASGLTAGTTYYVRVFSNSSDTGATSTFNVCIGVPPVGSVCGNPIVVTSLPYTTTDNTNLYGDDYDFPNGGNSGCSGTSNYYLNGDDVVYAYTPTTNTSINIRIPGAAAWSGILVYTSCSDIGTAAVACASGSDIGNREINQFSVTAGTTYYIVLSTFPSPQSFAYTLNITENTCIAPAVTFSRTSNCAVSPGFFVNANITSLGTATSLTVTDNQSSPAQQVTAAGTVQFGPYPNNTSVILTVANNQDANCVVTSPAQNQTACPPVNDNCANAVAITPTATFVPTDGTNVGATASSTETVPVNCNGYSGGDVWFSVVVPPSGNLTIETGNSSTGASGLDTVVTVYSGACGSLVQVGCDDDGGEGAYSLVALSGQTPGSTLYLRVYEYSNDSTGSFGISAYDSSLKTTSFDNMSFKVYPNPVKDRLHLSYTENMSDVAIFNLLGQQVLSKKINATESQIDMSTLAGGTYLVKVNVGNQVKTLKIVKE
ncbi:T9SS type A sorting domain-containing protein, partial [Flavobacterium sp. Leaf359]|uniref:T9SS type A sorting domain-containing protein n=1 Tax=Flavobacterium sp. Leaf359 TaxID=1736351 RepID=UPI00138EDC74